MTKDNDDIRLERDALRAEVARLREALEPFAAVADRVHTSRTDNQTLLGYDGVELTAGHFRRARAALNEQEPKP